MVCGTPTDDTKWCEQCSWKQRKESIKEWFYEKNEVVNMAKLTEKEMEQILQNEIPLESLVVDSGICEFHEEDGISIGVSYEHIGLGTHCVGYIFNLFVRDEYINISGEYESIFDAVKILTEEWNKWQ